LFVNFFGIGAESSSTKKWKKYQILGTEFQGMLQKLHIQYMAKLIWVGVLLSDNGRALLFSVLKQ
jgi:hypothetical protein